MHTISYPGLYDEADAASNRQQRMYLRLIKGEYAFLIGASLFSLWSPSMRWYYSLYAVAIFIPFVLLMGRVFLKPEQGWYQARALAESIKTATWKYMMRAEPFPGDQRDQESRANFRNHLRAILDANRHLGRRFAGTSANSEQVTDAMEAVRDAALARRLDIYLTQRVNEQRGWYALKAGLNRRWSRRAIIACSILYAGAAGVVAARIAMPTWQFVHPEPLIVSATALIGWMQIKKFTELSASYGLTAHEIGIIKSRSGDCVDENSFSEFVDDAELAFSREHTQWIARQTQ
jgi:hypothetical protein